jgi:hypothetical protein
MAKRDNFSVEICGASIVLPNPFIVPIVGAGVNAFESEEGNALRGEELVAGIDDEGIGTEFKIFIIAASVYGWIVLVGAYTNAWRYIE